MNIEVILSRLEKVRCTGTDRWQACCPAHDDKSPSLGIFDVGDKILLKCHAGCSFPEICRALGFEQWELFSDGKPPREFSSGVSRPDLIDTLLSEEWIVLLAEECRKTGWPLSNADIEREKLAQKFISAARGMLHV